MIDSPQKPAPPFTKLQNEYATTYEKISKLLEDASFHRTATIWFGPIGSKISPNKGKYSWPVARNFDGTNKIMIEGEIAQWPSLAIRRILEVRGYHMTLSEVCKCLKALRHLYRVQCQPKIVKTLVSIS